MNSEGFQHKLDKSYELDHSDPNNLVNHITEVLTTAAEKCKIKHVKQKEQKDPPWFDKSCRELKEKIKSLGKKVRGDPKNKSLKNELYTDKKNLKKMVKRKKISFKNQLMEDMKQSKNDSKKFWKMLEKLGKKSSDVVFKKGIRDQRWVSHFKSIFNSPKIDNSLPKVPKKRENWTKTYSWKSLR